MSKWKREYFEAHFTEHARQADEEARRIGEARAAKASIDMAGAHVVEDKDGDRRRRRGEVAETGDGALYFMTDYRKARKYDSVPIYRRDGGDPALLVYAGRRTKKYIDGWKGLD